MLIYEHTSITRNLRVIGITKTEIWIKTVRKIKHAEIRKAVIKETAEFLKF